MSAHSSSAHSLSARQRLLDAIQPLFYNYGITSTGIDAIIKRANVAKKSLYNNFKSKNDLVLYYLQLRHQEWLDLYAARLNEAQNHTPDDSKQAILAIFQAYVDHAQHNYEHGFRGCGLLNAAAELPVNHPGRQLVAQQKQQIEDFLKTHIAALKGLDSKQHQHVAQHLSYLLEGAMVRAGLESNDSHILAAYKIAETLLRDL